MGSTFSAPSRAAKDISSFIHPDTDLRTHHPSSAGGTFNSVRLAADSANRVLNSVPSRVDSLTSAVKYTATAAALLAIQSNLTQKHIADSLKGIAKDLSIIAQQAEATNIANLSGNQGFPVQILNFANKVAAERNSRFILVYYPSNLPDPCIHNALSNSISRWKHLDPTNCFFDIFHSWSALVAQITLIRRVPEYENPEPICILFPSNCSSILGDVFCDIPAVGGLDPDSLWFGGQVDSNGPLTWLPADLSIAGTPLYESPNVSGLGFISMEKKTLETGVPIFVLGFSAFCFLCAAFGTPKLEEAKGCFCVFLFLLAIIVLLFLAEEVVVVRRMRSCEGASLMVNHSSQSEVDASRPFKVKWTASKDLVLKPY